MNRRRRSFVVAFTEPRTQCVRTGPAAGPAPLIRLRIGLHTGEVRLPDEGNYIGPAITAQPGCEVAHGGQPVVSGTTGDLVADRCPTMRG